MKHKVIALVLALAMTLAACSNTPQLVESPNSPNSNTGAENSAPKLAENTLLTVGTSSSGGAVYAVGAGISRLLSEKIGNLDMRAVATGGAVDNINLMSTGEIQIGLNAANTNYMAVSGTLNGMEKQDNLRGICTLYPSVIHFLVSKKSGITSFDDLSGTSGAVGAAGSGSECYSYDILKYFGYEYRDGKKDIDPVKFKSLYEPNFTSGLVIIVNLNLICFSSISETSILGSQTGIKFSSLKALL